ncbi:hypothetical protein BJX63DRAFT_276309 [Aspergillus granulosus]|uniref:Uncharacterized protein n=1 Tax=Aspergillus granulosus TaxID=176169 RepID=A0ABR4H7H8_9EURO
MRSELTPSIIIKQSFKTEVCAHPVNFSTRTRAANFLDHRSALLRISRGSGEFSSGLRLEVRFEPVVAVSHEASKLVEANDHPSGFNSKPPVGATEKGEHHSGTVFVVPSRWWRPNAVEAKSANGDKLRRVAAQGLRSLRFSSCHPKFTRKTISLFHSISLDRKRPRLRTAKVIILPSYIRLFDLFSNLLGLRPSSGAGLSAFPGSAQKNWSFSARTAKRPSCGCSDWSRSARCVGAILAQRAAAYRQSLPHGRALNLPLRQRFSGPEPTDDADKSEMVGENAPPNRACSSGFGKTSADAPDVRHTNPKELWRGLE